MRMTVTLDEKLLEEARMISKKKDEKRSDRGGFEGVCPEKKKRRSFEACRKD
jgi:hypothetical protein